MVCGPKKPRKTHRYLLLDRLDLELPPDARQRLDASVAVPAEDLFSEEKKDGSLEKPGKVC